GRVWCLEVRGRVWERLAILEEIHGRPGRVINRPATRKEQGEKSHSDQAPRRREALRGARHEQEGGDRDQPTRDFPRGEEGRGAGENRKTKLDRTVAFRLHASSRRRRIRGKERAMAAPAQMASRSNPRAKEPPADRQTIVQRPTERRTPTRLSRNRVTLRTTRSPSRAVATATTRAVNAATSREVPLGTP